MEPKELFQTGLKHYQNGEFENAFDCFSRAIQSTGSDKISPETDDNSSLAAMTTLGRMYHEGKGVLVDLTKAVYWYEQAALQGYSNAQYQLGLCYCKGQGVQQDFEIGASLYADATKHGHVLASSALQILKDNNHVDPNSYPQRTTSSGSLTPRRSSSDTFSPRRPSSGTSTRRDKSIDSNDMLKLRLPPTPTIYEVNEGTGNQDEDHLKSNAISTGTDNEKGGNLSPKGGWIGGAVCEEKSKGRRSGNMLGVRGKGRGMGDELSPDFGTDHAEKGTPPLVSPKGRGAGGGVGRGRGAPAPFLDDIAQRGRGRGGLGPPLKLKKPNFDRPLTIQKSSNLNIPTLNFNQSVSPRRQSDDLYSVDLPPLPSVPSYPSPHLPPDESMVDRVTDIGVEPLTFLDPITGFRASKILPFRETIENLIATLPELSEIRDYAKMALSTAKVLCHEKDPAQFCQKALTLSVDEVAMINLYTRDSPLYKVLNARLRNEDRVSLKPFYPLLHLLISAIEKLKPQELTCFRGVKEDISQQYQTLMKTVGKCNWWAFSSCTSNISVLSSPRFCGDTGDRRNESEMLLLPGTELHIVGVLDLGNGLYQIQLEQPFGDDDEW